MSNNNIEEKAKEIKNDIDVEIMGIEEDASKLVDEVEDKMGKLVKRINELAHKHKAEGLNEEETAEREKLRKEYLAEFKKGMKKNIMDNLYVMDEKGNKVKVKPKKK